MAVRRIRIPDIAASAQEVELDGRLYRLVFRWNGRMQTWFMDIESGAGVPLLQSVRMVLNYPLTFGSDYKSDLPPGDFFALCPTDRARLDPGRDAFVNEDCIQLYYIEAGS